MNVSFLRRAEFIQSLPDRPYCTNLIGGKLRILRRDKAITFANIQLNHPDFLRWIPFDIDDEDAQFRPEDRGCPPPNFIAINRANGHAHVAYELSAPVSFFSASSRKAMAFFDDVVRGMTVKLGADLSYSGFLAKNPCSEQWATHWQTIGPYDLETLNDYLDRSDKKKRQRVEVREIGRNVKLFDHLRLFAYRHCLEFKRRQKTLADFVVTLQHVAVAENRCFTVPLASAEIHGIVKSVAKWVWDEFSVASFADRQRQRARRRWAKSPRESASKPWEKEGISRRTWERRRKQQKAHPKG